jgi:hypothetical protein
MNILNLKYLSSRLRRSGLAGRSSIVFDLFRTLLVGIDRFLARIWVITLVVVLAAGSVCAQSSATQTKTVSVGVAVGLSLFVDRGLNFGTVVVNTGLDSVALTAVNTGEVTINGQWNNNVTVTLTPPASLTNGGNNLPYTPGAAYNNAADDPATATVWTPPSGQQTAFRLRANHTGHTGEAYIYIYGSINVGNVSPGTYSGLYGIAVTY